ncbi:MAG: RsmE family RNA methyltransferase [Anaerolineales bacterium]
MHHFFVPPANIQNGEAHLSPEIAHQLRNVLRMRPGDDIILLDNSGAAWRASIMTLDKKSARCTLHEAIVIPGEPRAHLTLYCGLPKKDKFEWILQKGTEVGVGRFVPLITARTVNAGQVSDNKQARWERIITEAAEQARRARMPELSAPQTFEDALAALPDSALSLIAYAADTNAPTLRESLQGLITPPQHLALFIGPEGGFTADEVHTAETFGAGRISLGARVLRTETAAIVAAALILHELDS